MGQPCQLLPVQIMTGHQDLEFVFEFHVLTIRLFPDAGNWGISILQKVPTLQR
jgi:hypothetical protein